MLPVILQDMHLAKGLNDMATEEIRTDTYQVGDEVRFDPVMVRKIRLISWTPDTRRTYKVLKVEPYPVEQYGDSGHTQTVYIDDCKCLGGNGFSGKWFLPIKR